MRIILMVLLANIIFAETVKINLPLDINSNSIQPLLIKDDKTLKISDFKVDKTASNTVVILNLETDSEDLITITALKDSGEFFSIPVRSVIDSFQETQMGYCESKSILTADSYAGVTQLVQIRSDRLKNRKDELAKILNLDLLTKLQKREVNYGFIYPQPLSLDLPEEELALRLYKLETVTKNIRER